MPLRHAHDSRRSTGTGETLSGFSRRLPLDRVQEVRAHRLQRVLLRVSRGSAGTAPIVSGSGCYGVATTPYRARSNYAAARCPLIAETLSALKRLDTSREKRNCLVPVIVTASSLSTSSSRTASFSE